MNQDILLVRLRQLVWKQIQGSSTFNAEQPPTSHQLNRTIVSILEDNGFKDVTYHDYMILVFFINFLITDMQIIRNAVLNIHDRASLNEKKSKSSSQPTYARISFYEPCDHIRQARMNWENGILEELKAIVQESKRPFLLLR
jgi:effector-binding domain-containing protein